MRYETWTGASQTPMDTATAHTPAPRRAVFEDGFGKRHHALGPGGEPLEVLEFRDEFGAAASFELALRERVSALAGFQNTCFSRVRSVQRLGQNASKLVVVSDRIPGARLSTVLGVARQQLLPLEVNAALCLIRQLVPAVAMLHEKLPTLAHGAISPERIMITPNARLVVVDHMLGSALEQLRYSHDRYWRELGIPLPPAAQPTFDQRADVMQVGIIALALILGRPLDRDEYPDKIAALAEGAWGLTATGGVEPLPAELRTWLSRMLQLDTRHAFGSAVEAWTDLERVLGASDYVASFGALKSFMAEYARSTASSAIISGALVSGAPAPTPVHTPVAPAPAVASKTPAPLPAASVTVPPPAPVPSPITSTPSASVAAVSLPPPVASAPPPPPLSTTTASASTPSRPATSPSISAPPTSAPPMSGASPVARTSTTSVAPPPVPKPRPTSQFLHADTHVNEVTPWWRQRWVAAAAALVLIAGGAALFGRWYLVPPASAQVPGILVVNTNPAGVPVVVDGKPRGVSPLTLELAAGPHELRLAAEGEPRVIPLTIAAGSTVSQTIELPKAGPRTGQLMVRSEPSGARVVLDGTPRGATPLTVDGLVPGSHTVALSTDLASVTQEVTIEPGTTASLVVPMAAPQGVPVSGWISIAAPAEVQVYEGTRLLGSSRSDRIMVSTGRHDLDVVNEALNYRAARSITVTPGQVAVVRLDWPKGSMALNAQPWADVWVDGERIGETPIGNIAVPIGTHEVTFRHPQLGEQVVRATVTAGTPARVSVDMRKR
jgi:serine/threonine protein kinase